MSKGQRRAHQRLAQRRAQAKAQRRHARKAAAAVAATFTALALTPALPAHADSETVALVKDIQTGAGGSYPGYLSELGATLD